MITPPFVAKPSLHRLKYSTKSSSLRCPRHHWFQIIEYLPFSGAKSCNPMVNTSPIIPASRSARRYSPSMTSLLNDSIGSMRSVFAKVFESRFLVMRPIPAPQSTAWAYELAARRCLMVGCEMKVRDPIISTLGRRVLLNPPSIVSKVGGRDVQYLLSVSLFAIILGLSKYF